MILEVLHDKINFKSKFFFLIYLIPSSTYSAEIPLNTSSMSWWMWPIILFIVTFIFIAILSFAKITAFYLIISLVSGYLLISLLVTPIIRSASKQRIILESEIRKVMKESMRTIIEVHLTGSENFFNNRFKT